MVKIRLLITFALFHLANLGYSQTNDIEFMVKRIKDNYAGYQDRVKGNEKEFDGFVKETIKKENKDTFRILAKIVSYFNNPHLQVYAPDDLKGVKIDSFACKNNLNNIHDLFGNTRLKKDRYEGYWMNDRKTTIIAILKNKSSNTYSIYYIDSKFSRVPSGYLIGTIEKFIDGKYLADLISTRAGTRFLLRSEFKNDTTLTTGDVAKWFKTGFSAPTLPNIPPIPKGVFTEGRLLDNGCYVLTLPDFSASNISVVDSIVKADYQKIIGSKTLILDIRNNTGGTVRAYAPLLPLVATQPIIPISGYKFCTKDLLQHRRDQIKGLLASKTLDSLTLKELINDSLKISSNLGKLVFEPGDTIKFDKTIPLPENVAIITNYSVESAAEMMVLDFKQSKKVKVFGEKTMGAVDYLNNYATPLPSKKYILSLSTFKRKIPPNQSRIDPTGILPDVKISDKEEDWVEFVRKYYEK